MSATIVHSFIDTSGSFNQIDVPGASLTRAYGINGAGQIVGVFFDSAGSQHGFVDTAGSFTQIDVPGAYYTYATGINDAGQIVGQTYVVGPLAPAGLTLSPASDSGTKGDNITNVTTPVITGTGEAGAALTLLDGATEIGTATIDAAGNWSVMTTALAVGKHTLTATQVDPAGNLSPGSGALLLTIEAAGSPGSVINGTSGDDTLTGTAGVDTVSGGGGNDVLVGLGGADTLDGGLGADAADYSKDAANGGGNPVVADLSKTFMNFDGFGATDTLISIENITGTDAVGSNGFGDVLIGDGGANVINGLAGPDYIDGGAGDDTLFGGDGNDAIVGGLGNDNVDGGNGDDTILLGDYLNPAAFDGNDVATGGAGNDLLWGYGGNDTLFGGDGNDSLVGNDFGSALQFSNDTMFGGNGDDTLFSGASGDGVITYSNSSTMDGGAGNDKFYSEAGNDVIIGGPGSDFMYGDGRADTFVFHAGDLVPGDADIIYFFTLEVPAGRGGFGRDSDTLQFDASLKGQLTMTDTALIDFQTGTSVASVFITNNAGWSAAVYGINVADLSAHTVFV